MNSLSIRSIFKSQHDHEQEHSENEGMLIDISSKDTIKSKRTFEIQSSFRSSLKLKEESKNNDSCNEFQYEDTEVLLDELDKPLREDKVNKCFQTTLIALEEYIENKKKSMENVYKYEVSQSIRGKINKNKLANRLGVFQKNGPDMFLFSLMKNNDISWEIYTIVYLILLK